MRPIEVFYHLLIPPDSRAALWHWWVDQQLGLIKRSKLSDVAKVKMCITMPVNWTELFGIEMWKHVPNYHWGHPVVYLNFGEKVKEYITMRYPFVEIIDMRDTSEPNIYEGQTLRHIYNRCQQADIDVCYIHSKGVINANAATANWREILNHYMIEEWTKCVKHLETVNVVGVEDARTNGKITSGNFWWSKSEHIRNLPNPLESFAYLPDQPDLHPWGGSYRYAFEKWVMVNNSSVRYVVNTETDHYGSYCFLENLVIGRHIE